jgi:uncharacterized protein involved in outer membrane biogenesis
VAIAVAAAALLGFVVAPPVIRHVAEARLTRLLGRQVTIARVRVNPFTLAVTADGVRVLERDERTIFLAFSRLHVDLEARSLVRRGLVVRELRLESPRVRVVRERAGTPDEPFAGYNFADIVARLRSPPQAEAAPAAPARAAPPRFSLSNLRIVDGALTYEDRPTASQHEVSDLTLGVPFISTLPADSGVFVEPALSLRVDGAPFAVVARGRPFDGRDATARVRVTALDLSLLVPLLPVRLPVELASASLDVDLDVAFVRRPRAAPTITARGRVALERVDVRGDRGAPLVRLGALEVRVGQADLAAHRLVLDEVNVKGLDVRARRLEDGTLDWSRLFARPGRPGRRPHARAPAAAPAPLPLVEIGALTVAGAALHVRDETARPARTVDVAPIDLSARRLSTAPGARGEVSLSLRTAEGGTVKHQGTLSLAPLAASGAVTVEIPSLGHFRSYFHPIISADVPSGRVRVAGRYRFEETRGEPRLVLSGVSLDVANLVVTPRSARAVPILRVPSLEVREAGIDFGGRAVEIGRVASRGGWLEIVRAPNGYLRLRALLPPSAPEEVKTAEAAPLGRSWTLRFGRIDLARWNGHYEDRSLRPPVDVSVSSLALHARDFRVTPHLHGHADLDLDIGERGHVSIRDMAELDPLGLEFRVNVTSAPIAPFQGYFVRYIGATIAGGEVSASGRMALSQPLAPPGGPKPDLHLDIAADAELDNVVTVDAREGRELARWSALRIGGVALTLAPLKLAVREVSLVNPSARLVVRSDGKLNLGPFGRGGKRAVAPSKPKAASAPPSAPASISIGNVVVRNGRLKFLDRSIRPPVYADADGLEVRLAGLTSDARAPAALQLQARVNRAATLGASGKLNPLAHKLSIDLALGLRDLDLPPFSPYAAKYAGHKVDKGKLSLSVRCHLLNGQMRADNRVVLDQLELGPKVDSPHATKAPVSLAVSVLRDRSGRIDLALPVTGSVDDPKFRLGEAIDRAIGNVIGRVVTAPFALLAAAFSGGGGGETLSRIEFAPGSVALDDAGARKLRALGEALHERRELSFEIEGVADPTREGHGASEDALVVLARRRAAAVQKALAGAAPDAGARLFFLRPRIAKGGGPHVQLRLKKP